MFLRTLIAGKPDEALRRVSQAIDGVGAIVRSAESVAGLHQHMRAEPFDLVVLDLDSTEGAKPSLIRELRELPETPEVIVLVAQENAEQRGEFLAAGAYAVLFRELPAELFNDVLTTLAERRLMEGHARLQPIPNEDYRLSDYVTRSPAMQAVLRSARRIAARDTTVLLLGATGVGKGLLARSLHNEGPRSDGPFIAMNCGALTETLLEAELFGHERGAFTGADRARRGYFELAHRGTLFLDEIAELALHLQVKLLHVLEERRVRPVGSEKKIDIDVRLIAATNRDLPCEVKENRFREDLFYRLNVVTLTLPSLHERTEDIPEIAQSYVEHFRRQIGSDAKRISDGAMAAILAYPWPGNVRELANAIERAIIMAAGDEIEVGDLAVDIQMAPEPSGNLASAHATKPDPSWVGRSWSDVRRQVLEETEVRYLRGLLEANHGRIGESAAQAAMDTRSLHQKMKKYGLRKEDFQRG